MRIIGVSCSPRRGKSTLEALQTCMEGVADAAPAAETEIIELAGKTVGGCVACGQCKNELACALDDDFNEIIAALDRPDPAGLVIGTPVYLGSMTAQCKAFLDRSVVFRRNSFRFRNVVGGVLAVGGVRSGGQELTIQAVQAAMLIHDMVVVGDGLDTSHFGGTLWNAKGDGLGEDAFGRKTARNLGMRIGATALRMHGDGD